MKENEGVVDHATTREFDVSSQRIHVDKGREHETVAFDCEGDIRRVLVIDKDPASPAHVEIQVIDELKKIREGVKFDGVKFTKDRFGVCHIHRDGAGVLIHRLDDLVAMRSQHFEYEPHLEVAYQVLKDFNVIASDTFGEAFRHYADPVQSPEGVNAINELIRAIQAKLKSPAFKKKLADRRKGIKRIRNAFRGIWRRCFSRRARVLIGRLDLEYRLNGNPQAFHPLFSPQYPDRFLLEVFLNDRDRFINNLRDLQKKGGLAENLLEWGWKIECGVKRGWHLHCVFFFDASRVKSAWYQMELIGELWVRLTEGRGTYFNPHQGGKEYRSRFIGEVRRGDEQAEKAYEMFVEYLSKDDQVPVVKTSKKLQMFGVSRGKRHGAQ